MYRALRAAGYFVIVIGAIFGWLGLSAMMTDQLISGLGLVALAGMAICAGSWFVGLFPKAHEEFQKTLPKD